METKCFENKVQGDSNKESFRVEIIPLGINSVEINMYEDGDVKRYRSWKLPVAVVDSIAAWWQGQGAVKASGVWKSCISINVPAPSSRHIDVRELDAMGRPKIEEWSLPVVVVEAMVKELDSFKDSPK